MAKIFITAALILFFGICVFYIINKLIDGDKESKKMKQKRKEEAFANLEKEKVTSKTTE